MSEQISFPDTGKVHGPFLTHKGLDQLYDCAVILLFSLCTHVSIFVVTSAHTLLGPVILTSGLVEHKLCFDQLCGFTFVLLSSLCTPVLHFVITSYTYVQTCGIHTLLESVVRLYSHTVIQSVYACMAFCYSEHLYCSACPPALPQ